MSVMASAYSTTEHPNNNVALNEYSCSASFTLKSAWEGYAAYQCLAYWSYDPKTRKCTLLRQYPGDPSGPYTVEFSTPGTYYYIVGVGIPENMNAPARMPANDKASSLISPNNMPDATFDVKHYDVYEIVVTPPTIEHPLSTLELNENEDYKVIWLSSTLNGKDENGMQYCLVDGGFYVEVIRNETIVVDKEDNKRVSEMVELNLPVGYHTCVVNAWDRDKENIKWTDIYYIQIVRPEPLVNVRFVTDDPTFWRELGEGIGAEQPAGTTSNIDPNIKSVMVEDNEVSVVYLYEDMTYYSRNCEDKVYRKWDDVLLVDNGPEGGNGHYVGYHWFKNGKPIDGEDKQWIRIAWDNADEPYRSQFYACVVRDDGTVFFTCPDTFYSFPRSETGHHYTEPTPSPAKWLQNGNLVIEHNGKQYNAQGVEIK